MHTMKVDELQSPLKKMCAFRTYSRRLGELRKGSRFFNENGHSIK